REKPLLEILVEGMGHINFAQYLVDRKGITDRVTLDGMTLMDWETFNLPLTTPPATATPGPLDRGIFFKGNFRLDSTADTYFDVAAFKKGIMWVNGHNLGRYWYVGPQRRLYCPASWLKKGENEVVILDLQQRQPASVRGVTTLE
ncbi:MAG TPA: hypothetical protein VHE54_16390, partial [Puia sp.]|nr:hypothetical protein [Puia sp.]